MLGACSRGGAGAEGGVEADEDLLEDEELIVDLCVLRIISSSSGFPLGVGVFGARALGAAGADAIILSCSIGALVGADDFLATALSSTT